MDTFLAISSYIFSKFSKVLNNKYNSKLKKYILDKKKIIQKHKIENAFWNSKIYFINLNLNIFG